MRQRGPCVRALCEPAALLLSKNMARTRPRCNATPSEDFVLQKSHLKLHTSPFTLHTSSHLISSHLISSHLTSSYLISSHLISSHICNLYNFFSTNFISADHCSTFLISWKLFWTHLRDSVRQKAFAVSTSHYYFVLQNLHNVLPSTTLYYKWVRLMDGGKSAEHNQDEQRWIQTSGGRGSLWCLYAGLFDKKR